MKENEVISKIKSLKKIEPDQNWVALTKSEIFDNNNKKKSFFDFSFENVFARSAMAAVSGLGMIALMIVFSQSASPGDSLYSVKRMTEKGMMLVSQQDRQDFNRSMAFRRLDEISKIVKENQIERLSLAVEELEKAKSDMKRDFAQSVESKPREEAVKEAREFASNVLKIEDEKGMLLGPLGVKVEVDESSSQSSSKYLTEFLMEDYRERNLTEENLLLLKEAEEFFNQKEYNSALKTVLQIDSEKEKEVDIDDVVDIDTGKNNNEKKDEN